MSSRCWAEIDLGALIHNHGRLSRLLGRTQVLAVVKANAYGHGAVPVARALEKAGVHGFGVADLSEAVALRDAGIRNPILVLGTLLPTEVRTAVERNVTPILQSESQIADWCRAAKQTKHPVRVHLGCDTGMGRLGTDPENLEKLAGQVLETRELRLGGLMSHLACPDDPAFTTGQKQRFQRATEGVLQQKPDLLRHMAASQALVLHPDLRYELVRPGIALLGMNPGGLDPLGLQPVLSLRTTIASLRWADPGETIGYQATHRVRKRTRVATLPIGYADGVPLAASNRGEVLLEGQAAPILGRVTMDYIMVDVTEIPDLRVGTPATIIGRDRGREITAGDWARWSGLIPYAITTGLGTRVDRRLIPQTRTREKAA